MGVPGRRTRDHGHTLKQWSFQLYVRKKVIVGQFALEHTVQSDNGISCWRFSRPTGESAKQPDVNTKALTLLWAEGWATDLPKAPSSMSDL